MELIRDVAYLNIYRVKQLPLRRNQIRKQVMANFTNVTVGNEDGVDLVKTRPFLLYCVNKVIVTLTSLC